MMSVCSGTSAMGLEAWFLHKTPMGESSLRVHFFTREQGILTCWYKGGRSPKKQAQLQPFMPLWLSIDKKKDYCYLRQVESQSLAFSLKSMSLFSACYINELLYVVIKPMDAQPMLYDAYQEVLQGLALIKAEGRLSIEALLRRFEWILLQACGYGLSLSEDERDSLVVNKYYRYVPGEGFMVTAACSDGFGIPGASVLSIIKGDFADLTVLKSAKRVMRQAIDFLLEGRVLQSRSLVQKC